MEEVSPVLHVIFRHLLIRLDDQELREPRGSRQGKTCLLIHIRNFPDSEKAGLLTARLFGEHHYAPDDVVYATPSADHLHRFDAKGAAIR